MKKREHKKALVETADLAKPKVPASTVEPVPGRRVSLLLVGLAALVAGIGLHSLITAGPTQVLQGQLAASRAEAAAAQENLRALQVKMDAMPAQITQAVTEEKTRLESAFHEQRTKLEAEMAAANAANREERAGLEARLKEMADRLAQAKSTIATLNEVSEAQKAALSKNNQYISTLGGKLREAYAATQNTQGQASVDKLDADRAHMEAELAQHQAEAAGHPSSAKPPVPSH